MIVRNEEDRLPACLESVRGLADEVVVADTGSTDATARIAAGHGARVIPFDFTHVDFAAARNRTLEAATGEWIVSLDADETLAGGSATKIRELIAGGEGAGYYFTRHNHAVGGGGTRVDYAVRLFPNKPGYRYRGRVHETVDASILAGGGRLRRSEVRIDHHLPADPGARRRKNHDYIRILKEELGAAPDDYSRLDFLAAEYHQLEMYGEATLVAECIAQVRPFDARAHLNAGIYHLMFRTDPERAMADFRRALELRPGYPEALAFLGRLSDSSVTDSRGTV